MRIYRELTFSIHFLKISMNFKDFLKLQFQPCIFCCATPEVVQTMPNYVNMIQNAWEIVNQRIPMKMRLVFPFEEEKLSELQYKLVTSREENLDQVHSDVLEITSSTIIREFYFRRQFLKRCFYPDVPLGILYPFIQENPEIDINSSFPIWMQPYIRAVKKVKIRLPAKNIVDSLTRWVSDLALDYEVFTKKIERQFELEWSGFQQKISAYLGFQEDPQRANRVLKLYADICVQKGKYEEALSSYQLLYSSTMFEEFIQEGYFCATIVDIISGNVSKNSLKNITNAKNRKFQYINFYNFYLYSFTELYIRSILHDKPILPLLRIYPPPTDVEESYDSLFKPFIFEQLAQLSKKYHFPLYLYKAGQYYTKIGAYNLSSFCYRASIDCFNGENWPNIVQPLCFEAYGIISKTDNTTDIIVNLMNSKSLIFPQQIGNHIKECKFDFPLPCGFVSARINEFFMPGFPGIQIRELQDEWKQTSERMFGAYQREKFFDFNSISHYDCCVGEEVTVEVQLKFFADIEIRNIYFLTNGTAKIEQKPANCPNMRLRTVNVKFTPIEAGYLEIYGVGFEWNSVCILECPFKHLPIKCKVLEPAPKINFSFSNVCNKVVIGQFVKIDILAENGPIPLDSFSILIKGNVDADLVFPEVESIFGQSKMTPLKANEKTNIEVSAHFEKVGKYQLILIFPYWKRDHIPPRYEHKIFDFEVFNPPKLRIERSISGIQVFSPEFSWALGFTGPFSNINQHLVVVNGRLCLLDFVSMKSNEQKFELPKFCKKFLDNSKLFFWYQNHYGIIQSEIEMPPTLISMTLIKAKSNEKNGNKNQYQLTISNIRNHALKNLEISLGGSNSKVLISGQTKIVLPSLDPGQEFSINLHILFFEVESFLPITLFTEEQIFSFSLYIDQNSFE
ncbi:hypothetical protein TRFO_30311 [Tritrichomonas foetus]|uniref:Uncharacterized protein n=1 Tax=Tritrichomonas foetus TaxID=1144522 RepID=A0A1J4JU11_9EUKA|nr:hypothetical protein TRFO_30311 [Tritrichomonas foetus]|eukprot:OHT02523.1 hypothetical protein TRFO_30311 [Tritrichomonas foetus]